MADFISKITPLGSTTTYDLNAAALSKFYTLGDSHPTHLYKYSQTYTNATTPTDVWYVKIVLTRGYDAHLTDIVIGCSYSNRQNWFYVDLDSYNNLWRGYRTTYNDPNILAFKRVYENSKNSLYLKFAKPTEYSGSTPKGTFTIYSPVAIESITLLSADPGGLITLRSGYNSNTPITTSGTIYGTLSGNASTASSAAKLTTARTLKVDLASTSASTAFDGSANITDIGVSGTLPVANGGTGVTTEALLKATYGIEYISGTQTAATNAWTGTTASAALYTGKTIAYYLPYAGTSTAATLNLTLSGGGTTGAKNVRINNSNVTTHFPAGTVILLVYDGTYWKVDNYDSNSNTLLRVYSSATDLNVPLIGQSSANSTTAAWSTYTGTYKDWYGAIPNDDTKRAKINLSTGAMTVPGGITANLIGNVTGNADTATKWQNAQTVYVTLGTASTTTTIQGGSSSAQTIGVNGTLGTGNGGTGNTSFTANTLIYANTATKLASYTATKGGTKKLWYLNAGVPTDSTATEGGARNPVYLNAGSIAAGAVTFDTLNANRLMWTTAADKPYAGYHYANSTQIAVNASAVPSEQNDYNFYVVGKTYFKHSGASNARPIISGTRSAKHLSIGNAGFQTYNNDDPSILYLNYYGGAVNIGSTDTETAARDFYGVFDFKSANGFTYSGIAAATDNAARPVWFSYNGVIGRPVYDNDFKYNPSTNTLTVGSVAGSATGTIKIGTLTLGGSADPETKTIQSSSTLYLKSAASTSIIFQAAGSSRARFDTSGHFRPEADNTYNLGDSSYAWKFVYTNGLTVNNANSSSAGGLALYSTTPTNYGIAMRAGAAHGWITAAQSNANIAAAQGISTSDASGIDWAINFYNSGSKLRGFKFMHGGTSVASINGYGYMQVNRIGLNRAGNAAYGRLYWYSPSYYTWVDYMSNSAAGAAPTGGQPSTLGNVTNWAKRSLIENASGYGWIWEAAANAVVETTANTTKPTAIMALSSNNGKLTINGSSVPMLHLISSAAESSIYFESTNADTAGTWAIGKRAWSVAGFGIGKVGTGSFISILDDGKVGMGTNTPSYKLHVVGDTYTSGWSRAASGFYCHDTGVHYTHNGNHGEINITKSNEMIISGNANTLYINYRAATRGTLVTTFRFHGGSSTTYSTLVTGNITPGANNTYSLGTSGATFSSGYINQIASRHLDAAVNAINTDHSLYIGYGARTFTSAIRMYYSTGTTDTTSSRTEFFQINSNGAYALTRFGVNGQSTSYTLYANGTGYIGGLTSPWIELSSATPYIDFHHGSSTADYTSRIISSASGLLQVASNNTANNLTYNSRSIQARLYVNGGALYANGQIETNTYFLCNRTGTSGGYYLYGNNVQFGQWYINSFGAAPTATTTNGTTTYSGGSAGQVILTVGNNRVGANNANGVANNAYGRIFVYDTDSSYLEIRGNGYFYNKNLVLQKASGANFTIRNTTSGQWAFLRLHNNAAYWDIATNSAASGTAPANSLGFRYNGANPTATAGVWITPAQVLMGAAWNDYAECRATNDKVEPGRCVKEIGDDTLEMTTKRLERGCEIVSDTYGFIIGKTEKCQTPIASSGRVLAYGYESREEFASHIGWPVCSGPDGTVSIMTEEEEEKYPSRIIGTVSAVPDYEEWGTGNVKVNGRVWIRIR